MTSWLESRENKHKGDKSQLSISSIDTTQRVQERNAMAAENGKSVVIFLDAAATALGQGPFLILES